MNSIILALIIVGVFFMSILAYRQGLKDGQRFAKGSELQSINPVKVVEQIKKDVKQAKLNEEEQKKQLAVQKDLDKIMSHITRRAVKN